MHISLVLLLGSTVPAQTASPPNLDFATKQLTHWTGEGFAVVTEPEVGVSSADDSKTGRTALLHRTFILPRDAVTVTFRAAAVRPDGLKAGPALNVVLEGPERRFAPRKVRADTGLVDAPVLLPQLNGKWREYVWNVDELAGQNVRIAIFDQDDRPGCHVVCGGFHITTRGDLGQEFADHMLKLARDNHLPRMARYDSKRFLAVGNADEGFVEQQLYYCETLYDQFFEHFRKKGFDVHEPHGKLVVAIFDSQDGFDAYLGRKSSSALTGVYEQRTNRLVVFDWGSSDAYRRAKDSTAEAARKWSGTVPGQRSVEEYQRRVREWRHAENVATIVHETAHQLSYNAGLLNREGDVSAWLAEGLACYCEGTNAGSWLGIGGRNPARAVTLAKCLGAKHELMTVRTLIENDNWLRRGDVSTIALGYAQSWCLFRMLMEQQPEALKGYVAAVYPRRTPDHRLTDFVEAFGDLDKLEKRYQEYVRNVVAHEAKAN
jgi:hypothetical protein